MSEVTILLNAIRQGDVHATERLCAAIYDELRQLAASRMVREKAGHTLQATALVHESWLRLLDLGFSMHDLIEVPSLTRRLLEKADASSEFLRAKMSGQIEPVLTEFRLTGECPANMRSVLADELNRIVYGEAPLFCEASFQGIQWRSETEALGKSQPEGWQLARLNRLVLEDAFPQELRRKPFIQFQNRADFFRAAASVMRRILIDHARKKLTGRRGLGQIHVSLDEIDVASPDTPVENLAVDEALSKLAAKNSDEAKEAAKVVELRFFAGLSIPEIVEQTGSSERTVKRRWKYARAFLYNELATSASGDAALG